MLGLLFLLALAGLELDLELVASRARTVEAIVAGGIAMPFLLGATVELLVPDVLQAPGVNRLVFSLFLATALSISAIPVVARILLELELLHRPFGQVVVAAAMVTDAVGWLLVSVVTGLSRTDAFEAVTLGFFAPLFFAVAGLRADLGLLADPLVLGLGVVLVVVASIGKFVGVYAAAVATGATRREATGMGIGLNARGALEIVVAIIGLEVGIISGEVYTVILIVAVVTTAMVPPLLRRLYRPAAAAVAAAG